MKKTALLILMFTSIQLLAQNPTRELIQIMNNGIWVDNNIKDNTLDNNGFIISQLEQFWDSDTNTWVNDARHTFINDSGGRPLTEIIEQWNSDNNTFEFDDRITSTYNSEGKLLTETTEYYSQGTWNNSKKVIRVYDVQGNLLSISRQVWNLSDAFVDNYKDVYNYSNGSLQTITEQRWNYPVSNAWNDESIKLYSYNGNQITIVTQNLTSGVWINQNQDVITINANNQIQQGASQTWNASTSSWVNSGQSLFTYNPNTTLSEILSQFWVVNQYVDYYKVIYFYDNLTNPTFESWSDLILYPNPAQDYLNIEGVNNATIERIIIKDLNGRLVLETPPFSTTLNVQALKKGMYFIELQGKEVNYKSKFIKK